MVRTIYLTGLLSARALGYVALRTIIQRSRLGVSAPISQNRSHPTETDRRAWKCGVNGERRRRLLYAEDRNPLSRKGNYEAVFSHSASLQIRERVQPPEPRDPRKGDLFRMCVAPVFKRRTKGDYPLGRLNGEPLPPPSLRSKASCLPLSDRLLSARSSLTFSLVFGSDLNSKVANKMMTRFK